MKLIYSGKTKDFTPELEDKVSAKLSKLSKFVEQRGEREVHLTHQTERHLHKIKLSMNFYDHGLVGDERRVKKMIEDENAAHPLTDEQITARLQTEGIQVTRRTVAKYREDMKIPSTHQRRIRA